MENRNSLQPIRTAAPADRLLGRVCSVGGRRYLDCGFDQLIAVSDADAARYADGAFVEVEIAAGATPWRDAVSQQQAVQQSFDQLIASIREHTTLEVGLAAADVERLQSELTAHALSGRRFRVYAPGNSCHFTLNPKNCTGEHLFRLLAGERIEATLEKGRIALESASGEELATLRPGQQAVVDARSRRLLSVSEVQTGKYTAWHYNHKVYECISFSEIVGLIEERYDVSVIYDPSSFDDTAYRLVVGNNEPLGQMLDILNLIVPIEYTVQDRRVLIKRKR